MIVKFDVNFVISTKIHASHKGKVNIHILSRRRTSRAQTYFNIVLVLQDE